MTQALPLVALAGNPNSGKTTLFNALTGARARTGNYPGVTVDRRVGKLRLGDLDVEIVDVPGTYSLTARSPEERIAVDTILDGGSVSAVVVVVDATALERHLYFASQIIATGRPTVVAVNMMDEAEARGVTIDTDALGEALGVPVAPIVAARGRGLDGLRDAVRLVLRSTTAHRGASERDERASTEPEPVRAAIQPVVEAVERVLAGLRPDEPAAARRARALWALLSLGDDDLAVPQALRRAVEEARASAEADGVDVDLEIIARRYERIDQVVASAVTRTAPSGQRSWTDRIDEVLTHPLYGFAIFVVVMFLLFEALFTGSEPLVAGIEAAIGGLQDLLRSAMPPGPLTDLLSDGVIAGVGNVVVFVPQIAMLFTFIAVLEDSGYLARVAFVIDRVMRSVGLHGKSFVPLLSGYACAVPAVMATRTIENRRDRLVTMMALPLMSCSARLPVYALVIAVVFPPHRYLGIASRGALVMLAMYGLSLVFTLGAAAVLRRTVLKGPRPALVLELPPYRRPAMRNVALVVGQRVRSFLVDAGTIILAITVVLWGLLSFPGNDAAASGFESERSEARAALEGEALGTRLAEIDNREAESALEGSYAGRLGRLIEPAIEPLGFDWRIGVGLIGSFAAREVLVSTLGVVFGIGDDADEESVPLRDSLRDARRADGAPLFTPLSGLSLMVFFVLAAQCMSTLAVVRRESGSWRWPILMFVYMTALAYLGAFVTYQGGLLLGFT